MAQRGFTLVELAVTMSVFALLALAVAPEGLDWMRSLRVRGVAQALSEGLQQARAEAMRRNARVTLWLVSATDPSKLDASCTLSTAGAAWVISLDNPAGACNAPASATQAPRLVARHAAGQGASSVIVAAQATGGGGATSVTFNGFGQVVFPGDIASVSVTSAIGARRELRLDVSPAGRVRMCDPAVQSATDPRACRP